MLQQAGSISSVTDLDPAATATATTEMKDGPNSCSSNYYKLIAEFYHYFAENMDLKQPTDDNTEMNDWFGGIYRFNKYEYE